MDYKSVLLNWLDGDEKRINHSLAVEKRATEYAKIYNADIEVVKAASLLHDITKNKSKAYHIEIINDKDYINSTPQALWHAYSSAIEAMRLGITNPKIIEAIKYHPYGKKDMSLETMIVCVADYTEETRVHKEAKEIHDIAVNDITLAYLTMLENTFSHLKQRNKTVVKEQLEVYEYIKRRYKNKWVY